MRRRITDAIVGVTALILIALGIPSIFDRVWGYDFGANSNSLEVYVGYLRRKTESRGDPRFIHTVRGVGYVLRDTAP